METTPMKNGLPWSDPDHPCVGYGFTDTIAKSGNAFYASVLYWDASTQLQLMFGMVGNNTMASRFQTYAERVKKRIDETFWNEGLGMYMSDTGDDPNPNPNPNPNWLGMYMSDTGDDSDKVDIWGSAYAAKVGVSNKAQAGKVASYLAQNQENIFWKGQIRELPEPVTWAKTFTKYYSGRRI